MHLQIFMDATGCNQATTTYKIAQGVTAYFKLNATVNRVNIANNTSKESIFVQLEGDAAYPTAIAGLMDQAGTLNSNDTNNDFIWSPNSTSTATQTTIPRDLDWTNSYGVVGLPGTNMASEIIESSN